MENILQWLKEEIIKILSVFLPVIHGLCLRYCFKPFHFINESFCFGIFMIYQFYNLFQHFATDTKDLADLSFAPNGTMIAVWDSKLEVQSSTIVIIQNTFIYHSPPLSVDIFI